METNQTNKNQKSLAGQTIIVTGSSDGIGAAIARQLHAQGATVVIVGRSPKKTQAVAKELKSSYYVADFARLSDVQALAAKLLADYPRIDVLMNNAGVVWSKRTMTEDGHEMTFQINHLAPFLLTNLLKDRLIRSKARIINTSSKGNNFRYAHVNLDDLDSQQRYTPMTAYTTTKLENIMFTKELERRWGGQGIHAVAFHPGDVASHFGSNGPTALRLIMASPLARLLLISPKAAADTPVWLASTKPGVDWQSGGYYVKRKLSPYNPQADDRAVSEGLWERSLRMLEM